MRNTLASVVITVVRGTLSALSFSMFFVCLRRNLIEQLKRYSPPFDTSAVEPQTSRPDGALGIVLARCFQTCDVSDVELLNEIIGSAV